MIDFKEIASPEDWELFARDFFEEEGFYIETTPDRGPDGGKDILISETIKGKVGQYKFTWLVSCKHKAISNKAVNEVDEQNIIERVTGFKADGFIGMYTTVPSSGLGNRLKQLKEGGMLKDYRIFDHKAIENKLLTIGYSKLMLRYLPEAYSLIKPLHSIFNKYEPLECDCCGKDLLIAIIKEGLRGNIVQVTKELTHIVDIYVACQDCDSKLQDRYRAKGLNPFGWNSLNDLMIPGLFMKYIMATLNQIRSSEYTYEDNAFKKEKIIFLKLGQRVLREMNAHDKERMELLTSLDII